MTDKTAIQRIKELDHERANLFEQAKEAALRRANQTDKKPQETGRAGTEKRATPTVRTTPRHRRGPLHGLAISLRQVILVFSSRSPLNALIPVGIAAHFSS
jgi:hypothetical protein